MVYISRRVIKFGAVISLQYTALGKNVRRGLVETCTNQYQNQKQLIWKILDYKFSIVILMYLLGLPVAPVEHNSSPKLCQHTRIPQGLTV